MFGGVIKGRPIIVVASLSILMLLVGVPIGNYSVDNENLIRNEDPTNSLVVDTQPNLPSSFLADQNNKITLAGSAASVNSPPDLEFAVGTIGHNITWVVSGSGGPTTKNYTIYKNSIIVKGPTAFNGGKKIDYVVDNLSIGIYNFTIFVINSIGFAIDQIFVNVTENQPPQYTNTPNYTFQYQEMETGNFLSWSISDTDPSNYIITNDSTEVQLGNWTNGVAIEINIDGLSVGSYIFTITAYDTRGNSTSNSVTVQVIADSLIPSFTNIPLDLTYSFGATNKSLSWILDDTNPDSYIIYQNSTEMVTASWEANTTINYSVDGLSVAKYNITIIISDHAANIRSDQVWVTVIKIKTLTPILNITTDVYESDKDVLLGNWKTDENVGITNGYWEITLSNSTKISQKTGFTTDNGSFLITLDYEKIPAGTYDLEIKFHKENYEEAIIRATIRVLLANYEISMQQSPILVQGEVYTINATISQLRLNKLQLNSFEAGISLEGLLVSFNFEFWISNGSAMTITKNNVTNIEGFTSVSLSKEETSKIVEFITISAKIGSTSYNSQSSINLPTTDLPDIELEDDDLENPDTNISQKPDISNEIVDNNSPYQNYITFTIYLIITIITLIVLGIFTWYIFRKGKKADYEFSLEIEDLLNLRLILIRTNSGLPFYQENFAEYKHDPALVAGMTAALSNFFTQFEDEEKLGFEIMERDELCFTSHKTDFSVITLVSKHKFSTQFLNKIKEAQVIIEYMFETELTNHQVLENGVDDSQLQQLFESYNIKLPLLRGVIINKKRIEELISDGSLSNKIAQQFNMLGDIEQTNLVDLRILLNHTKSKNINLEAAAKIIFKAYDLGVLKDYT